MEDKCVLCGNYVPEGGIVCPACIRKYSGEYDPYPEHRAYQKGLETGFIEAIGEVGGMSARRYQQLAARTIGKTMKADEVEAHALHGMVGELGEIHSIYQKKYQGHGFDRNHVKSELGDLLWFCAELCTVMGWDMADVMSENIKKLEKRYPSGFEEEKSLHRKAGDV